MSAGTAGFEPMVTNGPSVSERRRGRGTSAIKERPRSERAIAELTETYAPFAIARRSVRALPEYQCNT